MADADGEDRAKRRSACPRASSSAPRTRPCRPDRRRVAAGRGRDHLRRAVDRGQAPSSSRSQTSVAATPWPQPISSTRSPGPIPSSSATVTSAARSPPARSRRCAPVARPAAWPTTIWSRLAAGFSRVALIRRRRRRGPADALRKQQTDGGAQQPTTLRAGQRRSARQLRVRTATPGRGRPRGLRPTDGARATRARLTAKTARRGGTWYCWVSSTTLSLLRQRNGSVGARIGRSDGDPRRTQRTGSSDRTHDQHSSRRRRDRFGGSPPGRGRHRRDWVDTHRSRGGAASGACLSQPRAGVRVTEASALLDVPQVPAASDQNPEHLARSKTFGLGQFLQHSPARRGERHGCGQGGPARLLGSGRAR